MSAPFKNSRLVFSALGVMLISSALATWSHFTSSVSYFRCEPGMELQIKEKTVRCYKPPVVSYVEPLACSEQFIKSTGAKYSRQLKHLKDSEQCMGLSRTNRTKATHLTCPLGYRLEIRTGSDRCIKSTKARIEAPVIPVFD